jgi:hypothetical protein
MSRDYRTSVPGLSIRLRIVIGLGLASVGVLGAVLSLRGIDRHARTLHPALVAGRFRAGEHAFSDELTLGSYAHMFYSHGASVAHTSTICQAVRLGSPLS